MFVFRLSLVLCFLGSVLMKHLLVETKDDDMKTSGKDDDKDDMKTGGKDVYREIYPNGNDYIDLQDVLDFAKKALPISLDAANTLIQDKAVRRLIKEAADKGQLPSVGDVIKVLKDVAVKKWGRK